MTNARIEEIKVLNAGFVSYIDHMGTDEEIISAARMSTGRGFEGWDDQEICSICGVTKANEKQHCSRWPHDHAWKRKSGDANLLDFMYRNKHATPFEMCELQIEVQAPIMVFREWHRHRTQSYSEFSARYSVMPNLHYVPDADRFKQNKSSNKQAASITEEIADWDLDRVCVEVADEQNQIYARYEDMLQHGVPKEVARLNTPVSRYSKMRAKTDLRNWLAFLNLRMRPNAQWEIRQYANAVAEIIKGLWPRTYALFEEYDLYGVHMSRTEMEALRWLMNECTSAHNITGVQAQDLDFHTPETVRNFVEKSGMEIGGSSRKEFIEKLLQGGKRII